MVLNQYVLPVPAINFLLIGMAFSTVFANMISEKQLAEIMKVMDPVIGISLIIAILNLGAPLDYHLIFGAGLYTAIYITARAIGKYSGAYLGASVTHAPQTVKKFLGFTLLPHSGVSLVFTGIKDRHGIYAIIGKDENRDKEVRRPRASIRRQLSETKQAQAPKKTPARIKKNELEV